MAEHRFVAMIKPLEPAGVGRRADLSDAVEFDEIARHMRLRNHERNAASREAAQRLTPARFDAAYMTSSLCVAWKS